MKKNFLKSYDEAIKKCNYFFDHSSKNKKEYYELKKHMEEQAKSLSTLRGQYHLVMVSFSDFVMSQPNNTKNLSQLTAEFDELFQHVRSYEKKYNSMLVVGHGALIRGIIHYINHRPTNDFWIITHKNCSVTIADCTNGKLTLLEEAKIYYTEETQATW